MIQATSYPLIVNRVRDDAYGRTTHWYPADVNSSDHTAISGATAAIYESGYDPDYDLARNGAVGSGDVAACADRDGRVPAGDGMISDASLDHSAGPGPDNNIGYCGYAFSPQDQMFCVRFRWFEPSLGRWLERDPAGYVDGMNLYQYVGGDPTKYIDPWGLDKLVFDGNKLCRVSDDLKECIKCWKGRSGVPVKDKDGKIEREPDEMPKFPEPTVDQQKKENVGPIPEGNWKVPCKQESKKPGNKGYWKRTDWNNYDKNRGWLDTDVDAPRHEGPWGEWFVRCEPGKGCEVYGRMNFNIHGGRSEKGGEWGSAGCVDLMCQDDDFFKDLGGMCGTGTHIDMIVDYSGKSMPAGCNEPGDPCKKKDEPKKEGLTGG